MNENPLAGKLGPCNLCGVYFGDSGWNYKTGNHIKCENDQELIALRAEIKKLKTLLKDIETDIDIRMGEWAGVGFNYIPEDMESYYKLREVIQTTLGEEQ